MVISKNKSFSIAELADICDGKVIRDNNANINGVSTLNKATSKDFSFVYNKNYLDDLKNTSAAVVVTKEDYIEYVPDNVSVIVVGNPHIAYARILDCLFPDEQIETSFVSTKSSIGKNVSLGAGVYVSDYAVIHDNAIIGEGSYIGEFSVIGKDVKIGRMCKIDSHVSIQSSIIGDSVRIHPGAKIGQAGFGILPDGYKMCEIKQIGKVIIGDNVRIGANTTIDRGTIDDTVIGDNCAIDNLVQIGHNVKIGNMVILCAQVGIAGSTVVEDGVVLAGQVGVAGHIVIGERTTAAAKSGIAKSTEKNSTVGGIPATDVMSWRRQVAFLKQAVNRNK